MKVGVAIVDVLAGLYAALGVLAALYERERSGEGQVVDTALLDVCVSSLANVASNYLVGGKVAKRLGNAHPNIVPYQSFRAADQEVVIAVGNDRQFRRLAEVLGKPELAEDGRFATNRDRLSRREELTEALQRVFETRPAREWMELLQGAGIPCAPIQSIDQVFGHPQVRAREMVVEMPHPSAEKVKLVGSPLKLSRTPVTYRRHPPLAGEHTQEILAELGYSEEEIEKLRREGVI
jgi:crotonobetainyl-CoA:carnitine CoA-transferase CaiB-like acyl-CoA transferase